jgi:cytochrome P450
MFNPLRLLSNVCQGVSLFPERQKFEMVCPSDHDAVQSSRHYDLTSHKTLSDWDHGSDMVQTNQIRAYDDMRVRCPVAYSDHLGWSLFRHADVVRVLDDHRTFSNVASSHLSVPNGMDPPRHTEYRRLIEHYFAPDRVEAFEPVFRSISRSLVSELRRGGEIDIVVQLAERFAVHVQCAFLGWPADLHEPLLLWVRKNHKATLARDGDALAAVALEFDGYITQLLEKRLEAGCAEPNDITRELLREEINGRPLGREEIVSILRNWTVGELGTITACVGILCHYLASNPQVQRRVRADMRLLPAAIDEILRMHAPLIANRRVTTKPVEIGGRRLAARQRVTLIWASANRDETVFGDPDEFRLDRDPSLNLLYGRGIHVCPGAQLARLELCVVMEEVLRSTRDMALVPGRPPVFAVYPASGFSTLPVKIS